MTNNFKNIIVVVPVFNEGINGKLLFERIANVVQKENYNFKLIFVEDGSEDKVIEHIKDTDFANSKIEINSIELLKNYGHQTALTAGIRNATACDALIMMDGDLQHPPEMIPKFLRSWEEGFLIVQGVRTNKQEKKLKNVLSDLFYFFMRIFNKKNKHHLRGASDFRLIDHKVVEIINESLVNGGSLRGLIPSLELPTAFIRYQITDRVFGESKFTYKKMMKMAFINFFYYSNSLLILTFTFALSMIVLILAFSIFIIYERIVLNIFVAGQASILFSILMSTFAIISIQSATLVYILHIDRSIKGTSLFIVRNKRKLNEQS